MPIINFVAQACEIASARLPALELSFKCEGSRLPKLPIQGPRSALKALAALSTLGLSNDTGSPRLTTTAEAESFCC